MELTMGDAQEINFEVESRPFDQIVKTANLPLFLQYDVSQELDPCLFSPEFDFSKPLKVHSTQTIHRVHGRSARFRANSNCFEDGGLDVTVDDDYKGWFAVFGNPADIYNDPVVPHFRNIGKLAISPCYSFLVSGNQPLEAMKVLRHDNGSKSLKPFQVPPGTVLSKNGMYSVSLKIKVKKSMFKKKVIKKDEMYLGCQDELNNEMLIPCQAYGIFYVLCQISGHVKAPVMQMADIVSRYTFPLLVKLVHGNTVQLPSSCKGTFVLLKSEHTKTSLTSTLFTSQPMFFEIDGDAPLRFFASTHTSNTYVNDESSNVYQNCLEDDDVIPRSHNIRFRCNDIALTSARSSSTSGHGSGLSDEEDRFDWSKVAACSNASFLEAVDNPEEASVLFTHHELGPSPPLLQTQLSRGKDKKTKVETKAIRRTTMYETPPHLKLDSIPISVRRQSSEGSNSSDTLRDHLYENWGSASSSTVGSIEDTVRLGNEYGQVWSDTSSDISRESMEFVVENVTITGVTTQDLQEYSTSPPEEGATGVLRNSTSDWQEGSDLYDTLSDHRDRNSTHDYLTMTQTLHGLDILGSPDLGSGPADAQPLLLRDAETYEDPNYGAYQDPSFMNCQTPNKVTNQIPNYGTYEKPKTSTYISVIHEEYNRPEYVNVTLTHASVEDDEDPYEKVDDNYECIADARVSSISNSEEHGLYVSASTLNRDSKLPTLTGNRADADQPLYVNTASLNQTKSDNLLDKLMINIKSLGLKPATEEVLKKIDLQNVECCRENDTELRVRLDEMLSGISRIDFNKISLFFDSNQTS